jgi:uncharacterized membrane protein YbhN (UPF0104 family)
MIARLIDRVALVATVVIFCAAILVLVREFDGVSPHAVLDRLSAMPLRRIAAAMALTAASYLLLTGYDYLALRYARHRLPFRDVVFASFTAFVLSNNVGFQILSGGSIRYRLYSRLGLDAVAIGEVVAFCSFAYVLGVVTVGGMLTLSEPDAFAALLHVPRAVVVAGGTILLAVSLGYLAIAAWWREPIVLGRYQLRPPSLSMAIAQVVLASVDAILAATVMYVLLPAGFDFGYWHFLGIYTIAATASILSLVPGGLGVFETSITILTAPPSKAAALGVFFVYRMIYFILPLVIALAWFGFRTLRRRERVPPERSRG